VDDFDQTVIIAIRRAKLIIDEALPYAQWPCFKM
jgi:hypothetical protein